MEDPDPTDHDALPVSRNAQVQVRSMALYHRQVMKASDEV